jgi:hypothetical protein
MYTLIYPVHAAISELTVWMSKVDKTTDTVILNTAVNTCT